MSHTNQTANYHLPQFIGTDKPAWLVDVNQAMADIDTQMKANETASATAEADAQSALSGVTALNSQVGGIQTSVTALETQAPLDEAQIETNRQNIATNAQNIVDLDNRMGHTSIAGIGDGTATGAIADLQEQINDIPTVSDMTGATASDGGTHGLVPAPSAGDENKYLKGDGTWGTVSGGTNEAGEYDNYVDISSYTQSSNPYTTPNDGYVIALADASGAVEIRIGDKNGVVQDGSPVALANSLSRIPVYVKKGAKIWVSSFTGTGSAARFIPFQ